MGKRFREGVGGGWNVSFTNGVAAWTATYTSALKLRTAESKKCIMRPLNKG